MKLYKWIFMVYDLLLFLLNMKDVIAVEGPEM